MKTTIKCRDDSDLEVRCITTGPARPKPSVLLMQSWYTEIWLRPIEAERLARALCCGRTGATWDAGPTWRPARF